ncbi:hypothetical protein VN97_g869 [Penicillium thymicola]|uniref:Uncharacterized protein n=1 Tax=Penicillium thymicola TaxID=293382 RepID=A0AAI9TRZ1_PENTH|nr:hypothetical protein VN97_g869 [Penicillium thymicola]
MMKTARLHEKGEVGLPIGGRLLQPAPGLASYTLGQRTIISEHYAQIVQAPIYIVHDMTALLRTHRAKELNSVQIQFRFNSGSNYFRIYDSILTISNTHCCTEKFAAWSFCQTSLYP